MTERRIVSIWLPHFPMERFMVLAKRRNGAPPDDLPFALTADGPKGPVIHAANKYAREAGIRIGARAVDMRALCPDLRLQPATPAEDEKALEKLALWARRWCPWTLAEPDGLILDVTGSAHLFGGEAAILLDMEQCLAALGYSARAAMAATRGAAHALARHGPQERFVGHDPAADIAGLAVSALRLDAGTVLLLHRLGLRRVRDLMAVPRLSLTRRFSRSEVPANPLRRLDQALGRIDEPLGAPDEIEPLRVLCRLPEPIFDPINHLPELCSNLCAKLQREGLGARRLRLSVFRTDGRVPRIDVAVALPSRDARHLASLFRDRLEKLDPGFGFDLIALDAMATDPLDTAQIDLAARAEDGLDLSRLIDRLSARFGGDALFRPVFLESHLPERALARGNPLADRKDDPAPFERAERPIRLLDPSEEVRVLYAVPEGPPAQFVWRRRTHRITRYQGPERIAPEWWRQKSCTRLRDYYRVEDKRGLRFWLYREGVIGDGRGNEPRWFLHGLFS